jgi:hypothetical protein
MRIIPLGFLKRVLIKEINLLQWCPRYSGDINISFIKFSQGCLKTIFQRFIKYWFYRIVGSPHYAPIFL